MVVKKRLEKFNQTDLVVCAYHSTLLRQKKSRMGARRVACKSVIWKKVACKLNLEFQSTLKKA
jgi:hypothetical protein